MLSVLETCGEACSPCQDKLIVEMGREIIVIFLMKKIFLPRRQIFAIKAVFATHELYGRKLMKQRFCTEVMK